MTIEQDKKNFEVTVKRVARFNRQAARALLRIEANKEASFAYDRNLSCCFVWDETQERHVYWADIHDRMSARYKSYSYGR